MKSYRLAILQAALLLAVPPSTFAQAADPPLLSFDEIKQLYQDDDLPAPLRDKLRTLLTTPFVRNNASDAGDDATQAERSPDRKDAASGPVEYRARVSSSMPFVSPSPIPNSSTP